jgi:hypothetical protein
MNLSKITVHLVVLSVLTSGMVGCATIDRMETKLDMWIGHHAESGKPKYEGTLITARQFGSLIAMHFEGGQMYDVVEAPPDLYPGDVVRIYQTKRGLVAHLKARG